MYDVLIESSSDVCDWSTVDISDFVLLEILSLLNGFAEINLIQFMFSQKHILEFMCRNR